MTRAPESRAPISQRRSDARPAPREAIPFPPLPNPTKIGEMDGAQMKRILIEQGEGEEKHGDRERMRERIMELCEEKKKRVGEKGKNGKTSVTGPVNEVK